MFQWKTVPSSSAWNKKKKSNPDVINYLKNKIKNHHTIDTDIYRYICYEPIQKLYHAILATNLLQHKYGKTRNATNTDTLATTFAEKH